MQTYILDSTYLLNFKDLEEKSFAMIGRMDERTYKEFHEKMLTVAKEAGIVNPQMAIRMVYKTMEKIQILNSERSWDMCKGDSRRLGSEMPKVFVINGSKFKVF